MKSQLLTVACTAALLSASGEAAALWGGGNVTTTGFGVHAGTGLLPIPFIGTLGLEVSGERLWNEDAYRFAGGLTLRDLNVPLTAVDVFGTLGAEYVGGSQNRVNAFAEVGLRGDLFGPAGWRVFGRGSTSGVFGAGLGIEIRF